MEEKQHGGKREGAGRPSRVDEQKANTLFVQALREKFHKETDDGAKVHFIKEVLLESQRGQLFVGEHLFGKAPQEIKQTNLNIDAKELTEEEIKKINDALENAY
tara:strand:- start:1178 stop:1489 length:312 start_codon:yes stop_codon:yes gene_type:complete